MAYSSTDGRFQDSNSIKVPCCFDFELPFALFVFVFVVGWDNDDDDWTGIITVESTDPCEDKFIVLAGGIVFILFIVVAAEVATEVFLEWTESGKMN